MGGKRPRRYPSPTPRCRGNPCGCPVCLARSESRGYHVWRTSVRHLHHLLSGQAISAESLHVAIGLEKRAGLARTCTDSTHRRLAIQRLSRAPKSARSRRRIRQPGAKGISRYRGLFWGIPGRRGYFSGVWDFFSTTTRWRVSASPGISTGTTWRS